MARRAGNERAERKIMAGMKRHFGLFCLGLITLFLLSPASAVGQGPSTSPEKGPTLTPAQVKSANGTLKGQWIRPDGGYVILIKGIDAAGRVEAEYLNPKPIPVSRAEVTQTGATIKLFIELREVGYPGSTYTLIYDPGTDELRGIYFQAAIQKNFEVAFIRVK
jgi:hypothetical protein